ncbi:MAG: type II toxin-antitoxin system HicB family antitoxin [candidate division Zixibacteria bacterium]|nr:type II toxin-antitoxin system HicB family antitoxin [candidate division Zixibacteria bacterium]
MIVRFRAYHNGELWCAEAERDDIFAIGSSLAELMRNVDVAARVHFSGHLVPGDSLHIILANETGASG